MRNTMAKICALACALALACGVLASCTNAATSTATTEQQANRAYMSQVNEIMNDLDAGLALFVDAVSRGDIVNMRTQADNAYKVLDRLDELEVPESLADVHEQYLDGTAKLREALDAYIALYTDMNGASFDQSTYDARIAEVQALYDEGVEALKKGDELAADKS